ncbi:MAG: SIS domain-containing protein [Nitrospirales bacterium]
MMSFWRQIEEPGSPKDRKILSSLLKSPVMDLDAIVGAFESSADVKCAFIHNYAQLVVDVGQLFIRTFHEGRKVLLFGNGGSATDASHIAAEFVGRYKRDREPLPALALGTDMAAITCIANDYDYTDIFSRQILAHGRKGDVAVAISTSGNSLNVIRAVEAARERGITTVAWTGETGGKLGDMVDYCFRVPSTVTARIQECHITLGHVLCEFVEERLFGEQI